jgi:predicted phage terminase large subunit-like protein
MTHLDRALLRAALRTDFVTFFHRCFLHLNPGAVFLTNWHIEAIAYQLERCLRGEIKRLIINLPPRHLKSLTASVAFPAFVLGHDPSQRIVTLSYGSELSDKHSADFRSIVNAPWYRDLFPGMRPLRDVGNELITTKRGFRKSTSVSGALTGLGGNIFIIDDPQKPVDAQSEAMRNSLNGWYANTLLSRLDNKETGVIIVVMQRVHADDLSGFLARSSDEWTVLNLPAIAEVAERIQIGPDRFYVRGVGEALHPAYESLETLQILRRTLGTDVFGAQYQQSPVPPGGAMIKRPWLRYYDVLPERSSRAKVIQSWDTAAKNGAQNDWSVCTTWLVDDNNYYLLDLTRGRYEYPQLRKTAIALAERFEPDNILIEDASTGIALAQELNEVVVFSVVDPIPIEGDKIGRVYVQEAKFEAGRVFFPKGASFLPELETELLMFPQGRTDDQVDSITQALAFRDTGYDASMSWVMGERRKPPL